MIKQQLYPLLRPLALVFALILIALFFQLNTEGIFLSPKNITNLTRQSAIVGLLAIGMVLVIISGHIDLSAGSLTGLCGGLSAIMGVWLGWSLPFVIICTLAAGVLAGLLQGYLVAWMKLPAFIVTLGGMLVFRGIIKGATHGETIAVDSGYQYLGSGYLNESSGWILISVIILIIVLTTFRTVRSGKLLNENFQSWQAWSKTALSIVGLLLLIYAFHGNDAKFPVQPSDNDKSIPVPVLLLTAMALAFHFLATRTVFGRRVFAIGGNAEAAWLSGISIRKNTLYVFMLSGLMAAVAGMIYTARVGSATADAGRNLELDAIAACVIGGTSLMGGRGSVTGALMGTIIMVSLDNGMSMMNVEDFYQDIIKGLVLVGAVMMDMAGKKNGSRHT